MRSRSYETLTGVALRYRSMFFAPVGKLHAVLTMLNLERQRGREIVLAHARR